MIVGHTLQNSALFSSYQMVTYYDCTFRKLAELQAGRATLDTPTLEVRKRSTPAFNQLKSHNSQYHCHTNRFLEWKFRKKSWQSS